MMQRFRLQISTSQSQAHTETKYDSRITMPRQPNHYSINTWSSATADQERARHHSRPGEWASGVCANPPIKSESGDINATAYTISSFTCSSVRRQVSITLVISIRAQARSTRLIYFLTFRCGLLCRRKRLNKAVRFVQTIYPCHVMTYINSALSIYSLQ